MLSNIIAQVGIGQVITIALLSMVPTFEGRYALVMGQALGMPAVFTYFLALIFSTIPMFLIFWLLKPVLQWMYTLPWTPIRKFAAWVEKRSQKKAASVDTKGLLGLFVFVALPIPGTGVWTGSAIATLLNMNVKHSMLVIFLGNVVACLIMTLATYGVLSFLSFLT